MNVFVKESDIIFNSRILIKLKKRPELRCHAMAKLIIKKRKEESRNFYSRYKYPGESVELFNIRLIMLIYDIRMTNNFVVDEYCHIKEVLKFDKGLYELYLKYKNYNKYYYSHQCLYQNVIFDILSNIINHDKSCYSRILNLAPIEITDDIYQSTEN